MPAKKKSPPPKKSPRAPAAKAATKAAKVAVVVPAPSPTQVCALCGETRQIGTSETAIFNHDDWRGCVRYLRARVEELEARG